MLFTIQSRLSLPWKYVCCPCSMKSNQVLFFSNKRMKLDYFRKKTKIKKPRVSKEHPVVKYMNEVSKDKTTSQKEAVFPNEFNNLLHNMETKKANILGFDIKEFKSRVNLFQDAGISLPDAMTLSLSIPSLVSIANTDFKKIINILKSYKISKEKLLFKNPHVITLNALNIENNLKLLCGLMEIDKLDDFVQTYPNLLSYQINQVAVHRLIQSSIETSDKFCMHQNLVTSLKSPAVRNEILWDLLKNEDNYEDKIDSGVIEFLASYEIDTRIVYKHCPEFLLTPIEAIEECLEHVISSPFYFEVEDVEKLLKNRPDIFLLFKLEETVEMVKYLESIFKQKGHLYRLLSEDPDMLQDPITFFKRVDIFKEFGFKDHDIALLIAQSGGASCFTDCLEFTHESITEILKFYFSFKDMVPPQIVFSAPASLSPKSFDTIKVRIEYLRKIGKMTIIATKRKKKKTQITLQTVMKCDLSHFIDVICGTSLEHFQETLKIIT